MDLNNERLKIVYDRQADVLYTNLWACWYYRKSEEIS